MRARGRLGSVGVRKALGGAIVLRVRRVMDGDDERDRMVRMWGRISGDAPPLAQVIVRFGTLVCETTYEEMHL